jgi:hypothetical protein
MMTSLIEKLKMGVAATMILGCTMMTACSEKEVNPMEDTDYVVAVRAQGSNQESADYLILRDLITQGEISVAGQGIEQLGWCYYASAGNTYLSFSYDANQCYGYRVENGMLVEKGKFVFERMDSYGEADANTLAIAAAPWGGGSLDVTLQLIDLQNLAFKKTVTTRVYKMSATDEMNKWPTSIVVRGDKLYLSFYPLDGPTWETPLTDTAYVSVYSYPDLNYIKTMKDTRTSPIGYYGASASMIKTENGDIYTFSSSSYAAGFTQVTKPSGILRIRNGETEFDKSYFFDVEALKGYKLLTATYVGNGKAVARVVAKETEDDVWAAFDVENPICKLIVIDLVNRTATDVRMMNQGVDEGDTMHGGQYDTPLYVEDGKVHVSINNGTEAYLYQVNPQAAEATRGAKILGQEVQAIYKTN